jgi:hypothetical protein
LVLFLGFSRGVKARPEALKLGNIGRKGRMPSEKKYYTMMMMM